MSAYERGQILNENDLNWYVTVGGTLTDQYEASYQIWDIVDDPTSGTQIFPTTPGEWEEVTTSGKFDTGSYYAYDNTEVRGWQIPENARIGLHRIKWRWKSEDTSPYRYGQEDFGVVFETDGGALYIEISDVRNAGLQDPPHSDNDILSSILLWQSVIDRACRQWFSPMQLEMYLDGTDSDTLHFPIPIISIEEIKINDSTDSLDTDLYKVYNGTTLPDDRKNPRIKLVDTSRYRRDIYTAPDRTLRNRFYKGRQNQYVKGIFGYVESDGSTPRLIKRALLKLVIRDLTTPLVSDPSSGLSPPPITSGVVNEEWTDGHKIKYATSGGELKPRPPGLSGLINDPEVQRIITLYKAPIGMAVPANPTWV